MTWPQNAGNPISKDFNFKMFPGLPGPPKGKTANYLFLKPHFQKSHTISAPDKFTCASPSISTSAA